MEIGMAAEIRLVARIRIDFKVMPIRSGYYHPPSLQDHIVREVTRLIESISINDVDVLLRPSEWCMTTSTGCERFTPADYERQHELGDPGYVSIRNLTFLDHDHRFDDGDWEDKLNKARKFLLQGLHGSLFESPGVDPQFISTFLKPQEDYRLLTTLISPSVPPPTLVLKGLPYEWRAPLPSFAKLRQFFETLAILRAFNLDKNRKDLLIQFEDYEQSCKALKQLCSRSLKQDGVSRMVDYELTLKDSDSVESYCFEQKPPYNSYNESTNTYNTLNVRVETIEKELKIVKAMMTESHAGHHI